MAITLRQIRYFVATAEVGQISQAAIHLHISQSSVTSAIQELEALLGTHADADNWSLIDDIGQGFQDMLDGKNIRGVIVHEH